MNRNRIEFEKFIEASFFFNKHGKTKEEFYKFATKEWTDKKNSEEIEKLIKKHETARKESNPAKSKKNSFFYKKSPADESSTEQTIAEKQDKTVNVNVSKSNVPNPSSYSKKMSLLENFMTYLEMTQGKKFSTSVIYLESVNA